jgi:hypothetical protein
MYDFVVMAIAKNEDLYLSEWIAFHLAVGAQHIFLYDNESTIPISQSMKKYVDAGWLTVIDYPGKGLQMPSYTHFINEYGHLTKWAAVVDCDEMLFPKQHDDISSVLEKFDNNSYGGLCINWKIFGSNNHIQKPEGLTIEAFTMGSTKEQAANKHIKTILQPARTLKAWRDPHSFVYKPPYFAVNEHHQYVNGPFNKDISWDLLQINHYVVRSFDEYQVKLLRGRADTNDPKKPGRRIEEWDGFHTFPEEDKSALRFLEKTKALLL